MLLGEATLTEVEEKSASRIRWKSAACSCRRNFNPCSEGSEAGSRREVLTITDGGAADE